MSVLNWKTIDKLEAKVPGAHNSYKGEWCEFDVRLGRPLTPMRLDSELDPERFRIENKTLDISVEGASLEEAKAKLRAKLAASDDFEGTWRLWMNVDVSGGSDNDRWGCETATCHIRVRYVVELTTGRGQSLRRRHNTMPGTLPSPFVGKFPIPKTHKELSKLHDGPAKPKKDQFGSSDDVWIEATPELVETIRELQRRLGESGKRVEEALSKKRFVETITAIRERGGDRLLTGEILQK